MHLLIHIFSQLEHQKQQFASFQAIFNDLKGAICPPSIDIYHMLLLFNASKVLLKALVQRGHF